MNSLTENDIRRIKPEIFKCLQNAAQHLSLMLEKDIQVMEPEVTTFDVKRIPYIFGGSQKVVSGIYVGYHGENLPQGNMISYDGHLLLTFNLESAFELAAILMEGLQVPIGSVNGMTESVFSEIGNVFGTSFITAMANYIGVRVMPSVPVVINYRSTSILKYLLGKMKRKEGRVLLIQTQIIADEISVEGKFLLIPEDYDSLISITNNP